MQETFRVSLKRGRKPRDIVVFDTVESAYFLSDEEPAEDDFRKLLPFRPKDTLDVEWLATEWVYSDVDSTGMHEVLDLTSKSFHCVNLTHLPHDSDLTRTPQVYRGWLLGDQLHTLCGDEPGDYRINSVPDPQEYTRDVLENSAEHSVNRGSCSDSNA